MNGPEGGVLPSVLHHHVVGHHPVGLCVTHAHAIALRPHPDQGTGGTLQEVVLHRLLDKFNAGFNKSIGGYHTTLSKTVTRKAITLPLLLGCSW
jgi:hypothetical protein